MSGPTIHIPIRPSVGGGPSPSGIAYNFGFSLWTGSTSEQEVGDDATYYAAGWYNYTPPAYPVAYARLAVSWDTLAQNNMHGNTMRFTSRTGAAASTGGNRIIQDHLTGIEWYIPGVVFTNDTWANVIAFAEAFSFDGSDDWRLPTHKILETIVDGSRTSSPANYAPFSINTNLWTATSIFNASSNAYQWTASSGAFSALAKTNTRSRIYCRRFI